MRLAARSKIQAFYASFLRLFPCFRECSFSARFTLTSRTSVFKVDLSTFETVSLRASLRASLRVYRLARKFRDCRLFLQAHRSRKILGRLGLQLRPSVF